ncbi:MAG TPA: T9SS type A sorting domain-containing protein, partial [Bacteroidales bacterium]|nr:T9SS type A sorting domain-containing protein [Bacteroidales bacterium]
NNATSFSWFGPNGFIITEMNTVSSTLFIEDIKLSDQGNYYCEVNNECATITSETVYLEVLPWTQVIPLENRLSGVSTYLDLLDCDIATILNQLGTDLIAFELIDRVYVPGSQTFCWDESKGAKLYLNDNTWPTEFTVTGYPVLGPEMEIRQGWSIIPVWSNDTVYAADIFNQLGNNLIIAISITFNEVYWPNGNIFTLEYLEPGSAYMIKLANNATIEWDVPISNTSIQHTVIENKTNWPDVIQTGNFHMISVSIPEMTEILPGDFIGVFDANDQIAGMVEITNLTQNHLLRANGNDYMMNITKQNNLTNGSKMFFKLYRPDTGAEWELEPVFSNVMPNTDIFYSYGMSMIESFGEDKTAISKPLTEQASVEIYPNPATNLVNIISDEIIHSVSLLNILGEEIRKYPLERENGQIEFYGLKPGTYILQIHFQNGIISTNHLMVK